MDRRAWRATVHGVARVRHDRETFTFTWNPEPLRLTTRLHVKASLVAQMVKNLPVMLETGVGFRGWEDPLEKGMATHSSILAWRIPWTEEPGGLQPIGL